MDVGQFSEAIAVVITIVVREIIAKLVDRYKKGRG